MPTSETKFNVREWDDDMCVIVQKSTDRVVDTEHRIYSIKRKRLFLYLY